MNTEERDTRRAAQSRHRDGAATFASLSIPEYNLYFWGMVAFFSGMNMMIVLRGYLVYDITDEPEGARGDHAERVAADAGHRADRWRDHGPRRPAHR